MKPKLIIITYVFLLFTYSLSYSQGDYLEVKGNTKADSLDFDTFTGDTGGLPATPLEGELFYDFTAGVKQPKYYDGAWKTFGGAATKTIATKIVAASNTLDKTRADVGYVCDGTADQVEIQNAITALGTTGGAVYLLEGTYNISGSINMTTGVSLIGAGAGTSLCRSLWRPSRRRSRRTLVSCR